MDELEEERKRTLEADTEVGENKETRLAPVQVADQVGARNQAPLEHACVGERSVRCRVGHEHGRLRLAGAAFDAVERNLHYEVGTVHHTTDESAQRTRVQCGWGKEEGALTRRPECRRD